MKTTTKHIIYLTIALLVGITSTYAIGTLTPSGTAGDDTHYSTNDIYSKLVDFTDTPTATSSPFSVPGSVEASFRTLTEIYDLLLAEEDDLVAENIADGVTIFGVEGSLEEGSDPNTSGPFVNLGGSLGYQDTNTGLIWQSGEGDFECWSDDYCVGVQAVEYCQNLMADGVTVAGSPQNVWRLPTIKEWVSIMDYESSAPATTLPNLNISENYWSSTTNYDNYDQAWIIYPTSGDIASFGDKDAPLSLVKCVR